MTNKRSSRNKPTKKAASHNRSTTSSTTGKRTGKPADKQQTTVTSEDRPTSQLLSAEQRELFLSWLAKGASPSMACQKLLLSMHDVAETLNHDDDFRRRWQEIDQSLSQNVVSALYQSAMNGSVTAQTFWLKHHPPPGWCGNPSPLKTDEDQKSFEALTDDELVELAGTLGMDPPPELAEGTETPGDEEEPGDLPTDAPDRK